MAERPKKDDVLNLTKYLDQGVRVKFQGGREVSGVLKGYDQLVNLVLDDCVEYIRGDARTRSLSLAHTHTQQCS